MASSPTITHATESPIAVAGQPYSPFTAIANYGFLSNCHTGALVAPDGTVDWLCVPRFDSPSVFGSLLDRGAGSFRFAPFGINVPTATIYEPGTNSRVTSWKTPTGWMVVRDALTMGPRRGKDTVTPHMRPLADEDADHVLVRTAMCIGGTVEIDLVSEPVFDHGRVAAEWRLSSDEHRADAMGADQTLQLQTDMSLGIEGGRARARHVLRDGDSVFCALAGGDQARVPTSVDQPLQQLEATTMFWRDWVALDRAAELAHIRGEAELAATWASTASEIKSDILAHGVDKRGVLCQHHETDALDASTLLAAIFGFLPADDPRLRATVLAIADELTENDFVLRYRTEQTDDVLSGKEGSFVICSFWLVSALALIGEMQRARDLMERLVEGGIPACALRRGVRRRQRQTPWQLSTGLLAPRPGGGRRTDHRCRGPGRSGRAASVTLFSPRCSRVRLRSTTTNTNRFRWMR